MKKPNYDPYSNFYADWLKFGGIMLVIYATIYGIYKLFEYLFL